jgi:hypothetical protein
VKVDFLSNIYNNVAFVYTIIYIYIYIYIYINDYFSGKSFYFNQWSKSKNKHALLSSIVF